MTHRVLIVLLISCSLCFPLTLDFPQNRNEEDPEPDLVSVAGIPASVRLGESFSITIQATNRGGNSPEGAINTSFTMDPVLIQSKPSTLTVIEKSKGETIHDRRGKKIPAKDLLLEGFDTDWETGESHTLNLDVLPKSAGVLRIFVRVTFKDNDSKTWFNDLSLDTNSNHGMDQQGWEAVLYEVDVLPSTDLPKATSIEDPHAKSLPSSWFLDFPVEARWDYLSHNRRFSRIYPDWEDDSTSDTKQTNRYRVTEFQGKKCLQISARGNTKDRIKIRTKDTYNSGTFEWRVFVPKHREPGASSSIGAWIYAEDSDKVRIHEMDFEIGYGRKQEREEFGILPGQYMCYMTVQPDPDSRTGYLNRQSNRLDDTHSLATGIEPGRWYTLRLVLTVSQDCYVVSWLIKKDGSPDFFKARPDYTCLYGPKDKDTEFHVYCSVENFINSSRYPEGGGWMGEKTPLKDKHAFFEYVRIAVQDRQNPSF